ncbi:MAG: cytochrome c biogenesis protein DipZ [Patescibacteria group bacterium]
MELAIVAFLAGVLTVVTPCVLPILPIILGGTLADSQDKKRPFIIVASLGLSVLAFSLLLKSSTLLINIDPSFWKYFSGGIILIFGIFTLFPNVWEKVSEKIGLGGLGNLLQQSQAKGGRLGQVLVGISLGPVFSSCSPTYAVILAVVLPQNFSSGLLNLIIYVVGLSLALLTIAIFGQGAIAKLKWAANPTGWFRKGLGVLFVVVGVAIITGYEKKLEIALLDNGLYDFTRFDQKLIEQVDMGETKNKPAISSTDKLHLAVEEPYPAPEIRNIAHWINSDGESLAQLKGKVVLIDFWTYSCINCIRTLPYLKAWHEKYSDDGLVIIGLHAPEFAFEQKVENVEMAVKDYEITYPVGLDNDFSTWRAYDNRYWPAKYFIDKKGNLRHYHFGEGDYKESEEVLQFLLSEDGSAVDDSISTNTQDTPPTISGQSPETYLGYERAKNFKNAVRFKRDVPFTYVLNVDLKPNEWSFEGTWEVKNEKSVVISDSATLVYNFSAKDVYLVMGSETSGEVKVEVSGYSNAYGDSVSDEGIVQVNMFKLYHLVSLPSFDNNVTMTLTFPKGVEVHAFTFGSK